MEVVLLRTNLDKMAGNKHYISYAIVVCSTQAEPVTDLAQLVFHLTNDVPM